MQTYILLKNKNENFTYLLILETYLQYIKISVKISIKMYTRTLRLFKNK